MAPQEKRTTTSLPPRAATHKGLVAQMQGIRRMPEAGDKKKEEEVVDNTRRRTAPRVAKRNRFLFECQHTVQVEAKVKKDQRANAVMESSKSPNPLCQTRYLPPLPPSVALIRRRSALMLFTPTTTLLPQMKFRQASAR